MSSFDDISRSHEVRIRTARDLGLTIRERRKNLGWDQGQLAARVGVSRQWINEVERGKPRAAIGLLLRTVNALGLSLESSVAPTDQHGLPVELLEAIRTTEAATSGQGRARRRGSKR